MPCRAWRNLLRLSSFVGGVLYSLTPFGLARRFRRSAEIESRRPDNSVGEARQAEAEQIRRDFINTNDVNLVTLLRRRADFRRSIIESQARRNIPSGTIGRRRQTAAQRSNRRRRHAAQTRVEAANEAVVAPIQVELSVPNNAEPTMADIDASLEFMEAEHVDNSENAESSENDENEREHSNFTEV